MKVGDKVVCVSESPILSVNNKRLPWSNKYPKVKEIYTVTDIINWAKFNCVCLRLAGFDARDSWGANRFRPIDYTFGESVCERIEQTPIEETLTETV